MKLPSKVTLRFEYDDGIILEEFLTVETASAAKVKQISQTKTSAGEVYGVWDDEGEDGTSPRVLVQRDMGKLFKLWVTAHELDHALHDLAFGLLLRRR